MTLTPLPTLRHRGALLLAAALLTAGGAGAAPDPTPALPADSVYQLPLRLTDQLGRPQALAERRGRLQLVSLFYTSCQFVCPMLVDTLKADLAPLTPEERARVAVLLVSFDPQRDDVAALRRTADQHGLDAAQWTLARADAPGVRKLAAVLGIQYRALPNGEYNHSTAMLLLDADGRIQARSSQLGSADPAFTAKIRAALQAPPH